VPAGHGLVDRHDDEAGIPDPEGLRALVDDGRRAARKGPVGEPGLADRDLVLPEMVERDVEHRDAEGSGHCQDLGPWRGRQGRAAGGWFAGARDVAVDVAGADPDRRVVIAGIVCAAQDPDAPDLLGPLATGREMEAHT